MTRYYADNLAAARLRGVYELAPPRVQQYLDAEVAFVLARVRAGDAVLDLGCGYGRILARLAARARLAVGVDNAPANLALAAELLAGIPNVRLVGGDAVRLPLREGVFDVVACVQNGISAFHADAAAVVAEAARVTRRGGIALFSSYADGFWDERLRWFELQAAAGLVGPIDYGRTGDGVIVCDDGFTAATFRRADFAALARRLGLTASCDEVDGSSLFCAFARPAA